MKILAVDTEKRRLGSFGEREAARFLRKNGYKILRKNYCPDSSEIDIIAEDKETLVFIEVKTRSIEKMSTREPRPASAVTPEKQRSIFDAAIIFLSEYRPGKKLRFDIIEVYTEGEDPRFRVKEIKHLVGAFNRNTAQVGRYKKRA